MTRVGLIDNSVETVAEAPETKVEETVVETAEEPVETVAEAPEPAKKVNRRSRK